MRHGIGIRSLMGIALLGGALALVWQQELVRGDYWEQLSPWVAFLAGILAVLAGTLVYKFWRLDLKSEYYLRFGEKLPFGAETALGPTPRRRGGRTLLVGHAAQIGVRDFPPAVQRALWIGIFFAIALITVTNRAVALLRDAPEKVGSGRAGYCKPPEPPKVEPIKKQGCALVERAYKLGYVKSLGKCGPQELEKTSLKDVCHLRQPDEPYLHYAYRLLGRAADRFTTDDGSPGAIAQVQSRFGHLNALYHAQLDTIAMKPRSSHHLFTNLPDPRMTFGDKVDAMLESSCGARLAKLEHFPPMPPGKAGPSKLLEHVLAQMLLNPIYKPIVAQCEEIIVHWGAAIDACEKLAANPRAFLDDHDALDPIEGVLDWRRNRLELASFAKQRSQPGRELAPPQRVISVQCLIFDEASAAGDDPIVRSMELDGEKLAVREVRLAPLTEDGGSQIRLYKHLAELFSEGFGYGRLTSNQAIGARPEEATMAATFKEPTFLLTKLELLRDADLFLGNEWLTARPDLLDVYPYHLHLQNFVEIFRRQYKQERGRL
jgi:hypothetical protein